MVGGLAATTVAAADRTHLSVWTSLSSARPIERDVTVTGVCWALRHTQCRDQVAGSPEAANQPGRAADHHDHARRGDRPGKPGPVDPSGQWPTHHRPRRGNNQPCANQQRARRHECGGKHVQPPPVPPDHGALLDRTTVMPRRLNAQPVEGGAQLLADHLDRVVGRVNAPSQRDPQTASSGPAGTG